MNDVLSLPSGPDASSRPALYVRRILSVITLCASLVALALVLHTHRTFWFGPAKDKAAASRTAPAERAGVRAANVSPAEDSRYRALSEFVAKRYRVSQDMAYKLVHLAHTVGRQHGLDPLLIIAVIAVESRFNPFAESVAGAKGLMQIIPRYHADKLEEFGGESAVFDPVTNVKVGARILKEYLRLTGNMGIALQMYAGALGDGSDEYTNRVMGERQRLKQVAGPRRPAGTYTHTTAAESTDAAAARTYTR